MSVRQTKCPECKSTDIDKLKEEGEIDRVGRQDWLVLCRACSHAWTTKIIVKHMRHVRY